LIAPALPRSIPFTFVLSAKELLEMRDAFPHGKYSLDVEHTAFNLKDYHEFLRKTSAEAVEFKKR